MKPNADTISEGATEGNGRPGGFLRKTGSNLSQDSTSSKNRDSSVDAIIEETELEKGGKKKKPAPSNDNGNDSQSSSPKKDEGLGESFEQSESESSLNSKSNFNGIKNTAYDAVPEELVSENGSVSEPPSYENVGASSKGELPLDPSKLPSGETSSGAGSGKDSPKDERDSPSLPGSLSKKVSFYGSNDNSEAEDPVSETYVYRGKPKSRFGGRRRHK